MRLADLRPDEGNPRIMPPDQGEALARSIARWGVVEPIVVNKDGTIIGGHQRFEALRRMGATEAPCVVLDLDPNDARALNIALNKISGEWDEPALAEWLAQLRAAEWGDPADLGFTEADQARLAEVLASESDGFQEIDAAALGALPEVACPKCGHKFVP